MRRSAFTRLLLAAVIPGLGLLLCRSLPYAVAQEPPTSTPGTLVIFAGTGTLGYSGDDGPAINARLNHVTGLAVDAQGNLFVADWGNNRVRKVSPEGVITTYAKGLNGPVFVACDTAGNLFIVEEFNHRVRKMRPDGIITTVAGGGNPVSGNGDGGPAIGARLLFPHGVAVDGEGNLFIADWGNTAEPGRPRIRKVSPDGTITTVAGTGKLGYSGDGGPATEAMIGIPLGLTTDAEGNLYIAESGLAFGGIGSRVRKVTPDGIISTVAGGGTAMPSVGGAPGTAVELGILVGIAVDAAGNLYVADSSALACGTRDLVLKIYGVAAPGLIAGQPFPEADP